MSTEPTNTAASHEEPLRDPRSVLAACPAFDAATAAEAAEAVGRVLRSGRLILGPETEALEHEFAALIGVKRAVAMSSCTAALEAMVRFLDEGPYLVPTNTFVATAAAVLRGGEDPVFYDTDACGALDVDALHAWIDQGNFRALVVVHLAGFIPEGLDKVLAACKDRGVPVIEDCAHALGAKAADGRMAGSLGTAAAFSFYPTKVLTCGVGGMLTTDDDDIAAFARSFRHHGAAGGRDLRNVEIVGGDYLMDEMRAAILRVALRKLPEVLRRRRAVAAAYDAVIKAVNSAIDPELRLTQPKAAPGTVPSFYKYPVLLPEAIDRDAVADRMTAAGIEVGFLYDPPVHRQPAFQEFVTPGNKLPNTEVYVRRQLCLPMHAKVDEGEDVSWIVGVLYGAILRAAGRIPEAAARPPEAAEP